MMKRTLAVAFVILLLSSLYATAQTPPPMPKPGPEQKNLDYFAGTWKTTGDMKPGPMGPGAKFTGTDHIEWLQGGFFLVSHSEDTGAIGNLSSIAIYGYDAAKKVYTYDEFNSQNEAVHATGTLEGKVWTWSSEVNMGGKQVKSRFVLTEESPTAYTYKFEFSQDGSNWTTVLDGTGTKTASAGTKK